MRKKKKKKITTRKEREVGHDYVPKCHDDTISFRTTIFFPIIISIQQPLPALASPPLKSIRCTQIDVVTLHPNFKKLSRQSSIERKHQKYIRFSFPKKERER